MLEEGEDREDNARASDPASSTSQRLYAPKPAYDQLEVYSGSEGVEGAGVAGSSSKKKRRSGLSALHQAEVLAAVNNTSNNSNADTTATPTDIALTNNSIAVTNNSSSTSPRHVVTPSTAAVIVKVTAPVSLPTAQQSCSSGSCSSMEDSNYSADAVKVQTTVAATGTADGALPAAVVVDGGGSGGGGGTKQAVVEQSAGNPAAVAAASVPWPELPASPTLNRLQDAALPHTTPICKMSTTELESVFRRVELGLKIDRVTLLERLEVLRRQRDTTHANYYRELDMVNTIMVAVDGECLHGEVGMELCRLKKSLEVLAVAVEALVSAASQWAGVHHEWTFSRTVEVLQAYTDHTLNLYKQANRQIKHLNSLVPPPSPSPTSPRHRATSLNPPLEGRRLSLAPGMRAPGSPRLTRSSTTAIPSAAALSCRRASLSPNLKPFREPLLPSATIGALPALNLARVSSIVEEPGSDSEKETADVEPKISNKTSNHKINNNNTDPNSGPSLRKISQLTNNNNKHSTMTTITSNKINKNNVSSSSNIDRNGVGKAPSSEQKAADSNPGEDSSGGDDGTGDAHHMGLTEEAVARLQHFYRRAVEMPNTDPYADTDDLLEEDLAYGADQEDEAEDDLLMEELLEYERQHGEQQVQGRTPQLQQPHAYNTGSIYQSWSSTAVLSIYSWVRGTEQWPWSRQQTTLGARWLVCSVLVFMALMLLVAVTFSCPLFVGDYTSLHSGGGRCRQSWTCLFHPCHPYVQLNYLGSQQRPT